MAVAVWNREFNLLMNDIKAQERIVQREVDRASLESSRHDQSEGLLAHILPMCEFSCGKTNTGSSSSKET